jgi:hypothetical protein
VEVLQAMIRGESAILIAEQPRSGGAHAETASKAEAGRSLRDQLMAGGRISYAEATAYIDR